VAAVSIAALMAISDFDREEVPGLHDLGADAATMSVIIIQSRACNGGHLLELSDGTGGEATAFCPTDLASEMPPAGAVVTVTVQRSPDDPEFLYVREISLPTTVND
jgi:hypothetical protein